MSLPKGFEPAAGVVPLRPFGGGGELAIAVGHGSLVVGPRGGKLRRFWPSRVPMRLDRALALLTDVPGGPDSVVRSRVEGPAYQKAVDMARAAMAARGMSG